jgi:orotate phosphoribosyltransferase
MQSYKEKFIQSAIKSEALCFGSFELKSGRVSPYFFNAGKLCSASSLSVLAKSYAQALDESGIEFDVIFGPAYKGISLAALTAAAYFDLYGKDVGYAYDRKEEKQHGEGGNLVGADLSGKKILVIDDVITAGTAIRNVEKIINKEQGVLTGVLIGLNRDERGVSELSAVQEVERDLSAKVCSIVDLSDIVNYLESSSDHDVLDSVQAYRNRYGSKA